LLARISGAALPDKTLLRHRLLAMIQK